MLEASLLFLTLGPLAAFIVWEGFRHRRASQKPLSRASMERGFLPGAKNAERVGFILAAISSTFGAFLVVQPQHPPFTGRGAHFSSLLYSWFGVWGQPLFCGVLAGVLITAAVVARSKRLAAEDAG